MSHTTATERYHRCDRGHWHWGTAGAAGVLFRAGDRFLLQHRAPWVQDGGSWGIPGGASSEGEDVVTGALREAAEEGAMPTFLHATGARVVTDDHGGWAYRTVVVDVPAEFAPSGSQDGETGEGGYAWLTVEEMSRLRLHRGFAATMSATTAA
jgi:8-oxo-dGTP pyrophosphatase MutT (NUDIX family)